MKLLEVRELRKSFRGAAAVDGVSFALEKGEFLGLVGESGCGKSTTARLIAGLTPADGGEILLSGCPLRPPYPRGVYRRLQMVFQLPQDSFDPLRTIGHSLIAAQRSFGTDKKTAAERAVHLLERVGLSAAEMARYPHELSGGECQRAAIARAAAPGPELIICDEITSALDVSVQAQIVELLQDLRAETGAALLFISHDLALVQGLCERILVMHGGRIVEEGTGAQLFGAPRSPFTRALFSAVPDI